LNAAQKLLVVQLCAARYRQLLSFVNQSARWHYAVWMCVFSVYLCAVVLLLFCNCTALLKWLIWRSNRSASNSARQQQKHKMLKAAFRDNAICQTQTYGGFKRFKNDVCQAMMMMMSVLGDIWWEPRSKMWKECNRLSWKTKDERFTTFATLSGCRMEIARAICQMSSTCSPLQQNLCQGWWAKIKRNTASLSESRSRNSLKTTQTSPPTSLLVMNLVYLGTTLRRRSSRLSGRLQIHCDRTKLRAMSKQNWFFFFCHWRQGA